MLSGDADKVPTERAYSNNDPWDRKGEIISTGKETARGRVIAHEFLPEPDICLTDGEIDKSYPLCVVAALGAGAAIMAFHHSRHGTSTPAAGVAQTGAVPVVTETVSTTDMPVATGGLQKLSMRMDSA